MQNSYRFFANTSCRYYPCHQGIADLNCLFCYCPLYFLDSCPGTFTWKTKGTHRIKVCTDCTWPHQPENYDELMKILRAQINGDKDNK